MGEVVSLVAVDSGLRAFPSVGAPRFDLYENDFAEVVGNDVDLMRVSAPVAFEDVVVAFQ